jgi:hypothetical protein
VRVCGVALPARRRALAQIAAGAEAASGAAQDDRPDVGVPRRFLQRGLQRDHQRSVQRIQ